MQVFKVFMKVLKKHLGIVFIYIGIFFAISIPMSKLNTGADAFKPSRIDICIFDEDDTPESRALAEYILRSNDRVELKNDEDTIIDALYYCTADYILTINEGYAEKLAAGDMDGMFTSSHMHDSYSTVYMKNTLDNYVKAVCAYEAGGMDTGKAIEAAEETLSRETEVNNANFSAEENTEYNHDFASYFRSLPYVYFAAILSTLCPVIMAVKRRDIRYRTSCSSIRFSSYNLQIYLGGFVYVFMVFAAVIAVGAYLHGGLYHGKALLAVVNAGILSLVAISVSFLFAAFELDGNMLNLFTQLTSLGMSFLCGSFVPLEVLSSKVQAVGRFLPLYWYIRANEMLCGNETYNSAILARFMLIQTGFAVVIFMAALLVSKLRESGGKAKNPVFKAVRAQ